MKSMFLLLIGSLACYQPIGLDSRFDEYDPPFWYKTAWRETLQCAIDNRVEIKRPSFKRVNFYLIPVDSFTVNKTQKTTAVASGSDIYLTPISKDSARIVKHEMMHVMTQIYQHPLNPFYNCKLMWGQ